MTEQERPRTEAGPLMQGTAEEAEMIDRPSTQEGKDLLFMLGTHDPDDLNMVARVLAIEDAARTEGRQQAVREIRPAITDVRLAAEANGHGWIVTTDAWARLVLAAGLNASESPPHFHGHFDKDGCTDDHGDASESGQAPEAT